MAYEGDAEDIAFVDAEMRRQIRAHYAAAEREVRMGAIDYVPPYGEGVDFDTLLYPAPHGEPMQHLTTLIADVLALADERGEAPLEPAVPPLRRAAQRSPREPSRVDEPPAFWTQLLIDDARVYVREQLALCDRMSLAFTCTLEQAVWRSTQEARARSKAAAAAARAPLENRASSDVWLPFISGLADLVLTRRIFQSPFSSARLVPPSPETNLGAEAFYPIAVDHMKGVSGPLAAAGTIGDSRLCKMARVYADKKMSPKASRTRPQEKQGAVAYTTLALRAGYWGVYWDARAYVRGPRPEMILYHLASSGRLRALAAYLTGISCAVLDARQCQDYLYHVKAGFFAVADPVLYSLARRHANTSYFTQWARDDNVVRIAQHPNAAAVAATLKCATLPGLAPLYDVAVLSALVQHRRGDVIEQCFVPGDAWCTDKDNSFAMWSGLAGAGMVATMRACLEMERKYEADTATKASLRAAGRCTLLHMRATRLMVQACKNGHADVLAFIDDELAPGSVRAQLQRVVACAAEHGQFALLPWLEARYKTRVARLEERAAVAFYALATRPYAVARGVLAWADSPPTLLAMLEDTARLLNSDMSADEARAFARIEALALGVIAARYGDMDMLHALRDEGVPWASECCDCACTAAFREALHAANYCACTHAPHLLYGPDTRPFTAPDAPRHPVSTSASSVTRRQYIRNTLEEMGLGEHADVMADYMAGAMARQPAIVPPTLAAQPARPRHAPHRVWPRGHADDEDMPALEPLARQLEPAPVADTMRALRTLPDHMQRLIHLVMEQVPNAEPYQVRPLPRQKTLLTRVPRPRRRYMCQTGTS
jgi:hypothetical protein